MDVPSSRPKMCSSSTLSPQKSVLRSASPAQRTASPTRRRPLAQHHSFDHAVELLQVSSNIMILTGAGISTSVGIRDFRSEDGIYNLLEKSGYSDPQEVFHIDTFDNDPDEFYNAIRAILPAESQPGPTHAFIKLLQDQGKLLTNYTQNIDGLEFEASIDKEKVIQCHGTLATAECVSCHKEYKSKHYFPALRKPANVRLSALKCYKCWGKDGRTPKRPRQMLTEKKTGIKRKRSDWEDDDDDDLPQNFGILKPNMVFFGEPIADTLKPRLMIDREKVDLLIIIGTSLAVEPVKNIPKVIPHHVPQIFINKKRCLVDMGSPDIQLIGKCDVIVAELARRAGWDLNHPMLEANSGDVRVEKMEEPFFRETFVKSIPISTKKLGQPSPLGKNCIKPSTV